MAAPPYGVPSDSWYYGAGWKAPIYGAPARPLPGYEPYQAPAAPSAPAVTPAAAAPSAPAARSFQMPDLSNLSFSNDPILARVRALSQESIAQAEAEAKAARTRLVIGYGSSELANKLKLGGKVAKQVQANPFSTLQELSRGYTRRNVFDIDRPLSDTANLFYSTERGRQRALSGEQYLRDQSQAEAAVQERLAQISSQVTQAKLAAQAQQIQAEQEAYQRAINMALYAAGAG